MASDANPPSPSLAQEDEQGAPSCNNPHKTTAPPASTTAAPKPILKLNATMSSGKAPRTAGALYPSDVWSPTTVLNTQSAGLPPKPIWPSLPPGASFPVLGNNVQMFPGLGVNVDDGDVFGGDDKHRLDFKPRRSTVRFEQTKEYHAPAFAQTKEYHSSTKSGAMMVNTDPLPQHQFPMFPQKPTMDWSRANGNPRLTDTSGPPPTPTICISPAVDSPPAHASQPSSSSVTSTLSNSETTENTQDSDKPAHDVWTERQQGRCLRRALKDSTADWEEVYDGALTVLAAANPEHFKMTAGSVVINIKTDFIENLITSVRQGRYSVMDRVSERIMEVFNSRTSGQRVLFMISVNGGKKYCGLAEMSGPWDPSAFLDGWIENIEGRPCAGSFELRWIYIKDVWYHTFDKVRQPSNDHPISNMWNGMKFPDEIGREVVRLFVETPATASILGYPTNYPENNPRRDKNDSGQRRGTLANRGPRSGGRGGSRGGAQDNSCDGQSARKNQSGAAQVYQDNDATPTSAKPGRLNGQLQAVGSGAGAAQPAESSRISFDENGDILLTKTTTTTTNLSSARSSFSSTGSGSRRNAMGRSKHAMPPRLNTRGSHGSMHRSQLSDAMSASSGHSISASPAFKSPHGSLTGHHGTLQHSVSMNGLHMQHPPQSNDARALLPSGSMNSLPLKLSSVPEHHQHAVQHVGGELSSPFQERYTGSFPLRDTPTSSAQSRGVQDTPTHRFNVQTKFVLPNDASEHQLKARYFSLHAEKCGLQHQLHASEIAAAARRLLEAQLAHIAVDIRMAEMDLGMTSSSSGDLSPERYESFQHGDGSSTSSAGGSSLSPMRAENGHTAYSVMIVGSPHDVARGDQFQDAGGMNGDQMTQPPYGGALKSSWSMQGPTIDVPVMSSKDAPGAGKVVQMPNPSIGDKKASPGQLKENPLNFSFGGPSQANGKAAKSKNWRAKSEATIQPQNENQGGVRLSD